MESNINYKQLVIEALELFKTHWQICTKNTYYTDYSIDEIFVDKNDNREFAIQVCIIMANPNNKIPIIRDTLAVPIIQITNEADNTHFYNELYKKIYRHILISGIMNTYTMTVSLIRNGQIGKNKPKPSHYMVPMTYTECFLKNKSNDIISKT